MELEHAVSQRDSALEFDTLFPPGTHISCSLGNRGGRNLSSSRFLFSYSHMKAFSSLITSLLFQRTL